jgi:hypothetical protein
MYRLSPGAYGLTLAGPAATPLELVKGWLAEIDNFVKLSLPSISDPSSGSEVVRDLFLDGLPSFSGIEAHGELSFCVDVVMVYKIYIYHIFYVFYNVITYYTITLLSYLTF